MVEENKEQEKVEIQDPEEMAGQEVSGSDPIRDVEEEAVPETNEDVTRKTEGEVSQETEEEGEDVRDQTSGEKDSKDKKDKKDKKNKKDKKDTKIQELEDRLLRNMAEFENFRNRSEKEKAGMFEMGAKSVIEKLLPVVDNFERGLEMIPEEEKGSGFVTGMAAVYKQMTDSLEELGVTPIEAVGKEFDPNLHNAVMHEEDEEQGANLVVEEFQKGYRYHDTVVRHSMVKVVN